AAAVMVAVEKHAWSLGAVEQPAGLLERNEASLGNGAAALPDLRLSAGVEGGSLDDEALTAPPPPTGTADCPGRETQVTLVGVMRRGGEFIACKHGLVLGHGTLLVVRSARRVAANETDLGTEGQGKAP